MNVLSLPWAEIAVAVPLVGAAVVALVRSTPSAGRWCLAFGVATLLCSIMPWVAMVYGSAADRWDPLAEAVGRPVFDVDGLSAPLLPLVAVLHVLTVVATSRVKMNQMSFAGHLAGEALRIGAFACIDPWTLVGLLAAGTIPPYVELVRRGKPTRVYVVHMAAFVGLLTAGWAGVEAGTAWGPVALFAAVLVRCGTAPGHLWVADLFEHASFGTALLFVIPVTGVYAALRLVFPIAPDWVLQGIGVASLVTVVYAAGMAVVQRDTRRFFAYLFLSQGSLVLVGLELHTTNSLTGALCLWGSVGLSLGGLGLTLRAVESRYGRLSLGTFHGLYGQSPALAVCFLLTGLASVGFPGTLGFVSAELLVDGAVGANVFVGVLLVLAAAINGIAVLRAYLSLFTGTRHVSAVPLGITPQERFAVLAMTAAILGGGLLPHPWVANRYDAASSVLGAHHRPDSGDLFPFGK